MAGGTKGGEGEQFKGSPAQGEAPNDVPLTLLRVVADNAGGTTDHSIAAFAAREQTIKDHGGPELCGFELKGKEATFKQTMKEFAEGSANRTANLPPAEEQALRDRMNAMTPDQRFAELLNPKSDFRKIYSKEELVNLERYTKLSADLKQYNLDHQHPGDKSASAAGSERTAQVLDRLRKGKIESV